MPAEKPVEPAEAPHIAGGYPPKLPAALKRPAAAGPVRAVAVPVHAVVVPVIKHHAKSAAASPARTKPAPATKGLPRGWRTQVSVRKTGASAGIRDTYYYSPCGNMYRSLREAFAAAGPVRD